MPFYQRRTTTPAVVKRKSKAVEGGETAKKPRASPKDRCAKSALSVNDALAEELYKFVHPRTPGIGSVRAVFTHRQGSLNGRINSSNEEREAALITARVLPGMLGHYLTHEYWQVAVRVNPHKNTEAEAKVLSDAAVSKLEKVIAGYLTEAKMLPAVEAWQKEQKLPKRKKTAEVVEVPAAPQVAEDVDDDHSVTLKIGGLAEDVEVAEQPREEPAAEATKAAPVALLATAKNRLGPEVKLKEEITKEIWLPVRFTVAAIRKMRVQLTSYGKSVAFFNLYRRAYQVAKESPDELDHTPLSDPNSRGNVGQMLAGMLQLPPVCTVRAEQVIEMEAAKVDLEADVWQTVREHVGVVMLSGLQDMYVDACDLDSLEGDDVEDKAWSSQLCDNLLLPKAEIDGDGNDTIQGPVELGDLDESEQVEVRVCLLARSAKAFEAAPSIYTALLYVAAKEDVQEDLSEKEWTRRRLPFEYGIRPELIQLLRDVNKAIEKYHTKPEFGQMALEKVPLEGERCSFISVSYLSTFVRSARLALKQRKQGSKAN